MQSVGCVFFVIFYQQKKQTANSPLYCRLPGGRGYDPPVWPPKGLEAIYSAAYAPEVSVILGAALLVYLTDGLLRGVLY